MGFAQVLCLAVVFGAGLTCAMEDWKEEMFNRENEKRALHGSPPMQYSAELEARAQEWAEHLTDICDFNIINPHAPMDINEAPGLYIDGQPAGENIFRAMMVGDGDMEAFTDTQARNAAGSWYSEVKGYPFGDYDGQNPDLRDIKAAHFTQMVWQDTKKVGYGLSTCGKMFFLVARYFPGGNVIDGSGQNNFFKQNVHPAHKHSHSKHTH